MKPMITCPACKESVPSDGNVVEVGINAILVCPSCLTSTEVTNVHRPTFRWTLAPGTPPVRPPKNPA